MTTCLNELSVSLGMDDSVVRQSTYFHRAGEATTVYRKALFFSAGITR